MNSFDRYTAEMEKFERGKLFRLKYVRFIKLLNEEHVGPFHFKRAQSKYFEECLDIRSSEVRALDMPGDRESRSPVMRMDIISPSRLKSLGGLLNTLRRGGIVYHSLSPD